MSELRINELPFENLAKVFRFLDVASLKNATLTCKMWNNLIESECLWSLKLAYDDSGKLLCNFSPEQRMNFALATKRKFGTIEITRGQFSDNHQIRQILQRNGFNVVELILRECYAENLDEFAEFLNFTPNLKQIVIVMIDLNDANDVPLDHALPGLKRLKNLEIAHTDQRIINCFQKAKLRSITIWGNMFPTQHGALIEFLSSQEMLASITDLTRSSSGSILTEMGKLNVPIPFRLTYLAISRNVRARVLSPDEDNQNLLRFVESQAEHLRELELGYGIPNTVYGCVISSMTNLNSLTLINSQLPCDNEFYHQLEENCSVRTIKLLDSGASDLPFVGNFFKNLPNICSLVLLDVNGNSGKALVIAQNVSKLESNKQSVDYAQLPNLKTLHIQHLRDKINWNEFTKAHPLLTELTIEQTDNHSYLTSDDIDQITTNVDLHTMRLGVGFVADDRFFEIIRAKCKNLKVLDLHKSC